MFGGLLLLGARLGDLLGRRRVFVAGLAVFVDRVVPDRRRADRVVADRARARCRASAPPSSRRRRSSLLTASFPEGEQRSRAVAWYGATAGIGASLGLLVGGAAAQWISWRAGFFINVPIGIAMVVLAPRYLPDHRPQPGRFDLTGALSATLGIGALVFGIIESADARLDRPRRRRRSGWWRSSCWPSWSCTRGGPSSRSCRCGSSPTGGASGAYAARRSTSAR